MFFTGDDHCLWSNETQILAEECLQVQHGFYDGCHKECKTDVYFLFLNQNQHEHFVYGKLFPVLVFLVVISNVLVALVLSQKHMITPTNTVLKYMAVADLFVGIIPLPWNFFYHSLKNYENEENLDISWCYMYKYAMDTLPPIFHCIAMWLTVLLAVQRFISIEYPLKSREVCTVRNVRIATCIITILSCLCGLPKSFDFYYDVFDGWVYEEPGEWNRVRRCVFEFTYIVKMIGPNTFFNVYFLTRVFGFILIPAFLLTILNALLIRGLQKAQKRKEILLKEKRSRESQKQTDSSNSTSWMLVTVVSIFLIVNLPQALFMGLICISSTLSLDISLLRGSFPVLFLLVSNMIVMLTYPINFGIYCFMSSSFRSTFKQLFCSSSCRKWWRRKLTKSKGELGPAEFNRTSIRRSDPTVSVQLSRKHSGGDAELSTEYSATIVRHEPPDSKCNSNTIFL